MSIREIVEMRVCLNGKYIAGEERQKFISNALDENLRFYQTKILFGPHKLELLTNFPCNQ